MVDVGGRYLNPKFHDPPADDHPVSPERLVPTASFQGFAHSVASPQLGVGSQLGLRKLRVQDVGFGV